MAAVINDATTALLRALRASFSGFPGHFEIDEVKSRAWMSATFAGARHQVGLLLRGADAEDAADLFLASLSATEFNLRGHVMADIALAHQERSLHVAGEPQVRLLLEALTVEEG